MKDEYSHQLVTGVTFGITSGIITALGIAKTKNESATRLVIGHVFLALVVITISYFTGKLIAGWIK